MREGEALSMDVHRLDRLRARVHEADLAAAVLVQPPNLRYLTGFHSNASARPLALVVPAEGGPTLIVPASVRYARERP
jgi:Xaa-Pro aminopeptidase